MKWIFHINNNNNTSKHLSRASSLWFSQCHLTKLKMPNKSEYHVTPFCININNNNNKEFFVCTNELQKRSDSLTQSQWKCYVCYNIHKFLRLFMFTEWMRK